MVSMVRLNMVCVRVKLIYYSLKLWTLCMSIFWNPLSVHHAAKAGVEDEMYN